MGKIFVVFTDLSLPAKFLICETIFTSLIMAIGSESTKIKSRILSRMSFRENFTSRNFLAIRYQFYFLVASVCLWPDPDYYSTIPLYRNLTIHIRFWFSLPFYLVCKYLMKSDLHEDSTTVMPKRTLL